MESLLGLLTFTDVAETFAIAFAEVNSRDKADFLIEALKQSPYRSHIQLEVLDFSGRRIESLRWELDEVLPMLALETGKKRVMVLRGLESSIDTSLEYPSLVVSMNGMRDVLVDWTPHPVIFVLPRDAIESVARFARDFWSWSALYVFR